MNSADLNCNMNSADLKCIISARFHFQPCKRPVDWRAEQCWEYNSKPYRGKTYTWLPFQNHRDPCALTCQAKGAGFVVVLAPMVKDGTPCKEGSKDVCVNGLCKVRMLTPHANWKSSLESVPKENSLEIMVSIWSLVPLC